MTSIAAENPQSHGCRTSNRARVGKAATANTPHPMVTLAAMRNHEPSRTPAAIETTTPLIAQSQNPHVEPRCVMRPPY